MSAQPRVAILGAGPIGLEAALAVARRGWPFTVFEAAPGVAGHVDGWGHVRLFTPWDLSVSPAMRAALEDAGVDVPRGDACPTGHDLIARVYRPLAGLPILAGAIRCGVRVERVGRRGLLKHEEIGTEERGRRRFRLLLSSGDRQWTEEAGVVLDCTGQSEPNPVGDGGIPAPGETSLASSIVRDIPDLVHHAADWAGRTVLLVGAGHSAQTAAVGLAGLVEKDPSTRVIWALRGDPPAPIDGDALAGRARLTGRASELAVRPPAGFDLRRGVMVDRLAAREDRIEVTLAGDDGASTVLVDRILALTGRVGDHRIYRQLQVHECYATCGPMKLAAALLATSGGGDCLDQTGQGADSLKNPEPGFFILGAKSYGRRNDFLLRVGWEQVGDVIGLIERLDRPVVPRLV